MDLLSILPTFPTKPYAHILPSLERSKINTVDLISLDILEIAKRAHVPPADVRRLSNHIIKTLHSEVGFEECSNNYEEPSSSFNFDSPLTPGPRTKLDLSQWCTISTLDSTLDRLLDGGIPIGYLTEVTGESGCGKTQFLLSLLLAVQLPQPRGAGKGAIYISTEAPLATTRLSQLIDYHPYLSSLSRDHAPSLEKILSINAMDLETQDHILNYQLPVAIRRYNIGLVVIDSITSNYRAEHTSHSLSGLSTRSGELAKLGQMLRNLAVNEEIAIVVANQVSDRFDAEEGLVYPLPTGAASVGGDKSPLPSSPATQQPPQQYSGNQDSGAASPLPQGQVPELENVQASQHIVSLPASTPAPPASSPYGTQEDPQQPPDGSYVLDSPIRNEILSLRHQQRFFTGWGDSISQLDTLDLYPSLQRLPPKTPALGLVWSSQIACRIALKKDDYQMEDNVATDDTVNHRLHEPGTLKAEKDETTESPREHTDPEIPKVPVATDESSSSPHSPSEIDPPARMDSTTNLSSQAMEHRSIKRSMKLVFASWASGFVDSLSETPNEVEIEIWKGGLRSLPTE